MTYTSAVAKETNVGFRLESAEKQALERAAKADMRSTSALVRKIVIEWLLERGDLKSPSD